MEVRIYLSKFIIDFWSEWLSHNLITMIIKLSFEYYISNKLFFKIKWICITIVIILNISYVNIAY